jgi:DNA-binding transcriptional regulator YiaG
MHHADTLAEDVRRTRDMREETTAEFAEHFYLSQRTIEDWEQGRRTPSRLERKYLTQLRGYAMRQYRKGTRKSLGPSTV